MSRTERHLEYVDAQHWASYANFVGIWRTVIERCSESGDWRPRVARSVEDLTLSVFTVEQFFQHIQYNVLPPSETPPLSDMIQLTLSQQPSNKPSREFSIMMIYK